MLVLGWYVVQQNLPNGVALWPQTSEATRHALLLVAPLMAGLSAWVASREQSDDIQELLGTTSQSPGIRSIAVYLGTILWGCLAYLLITAALFLEVGFQASWGSPVLWPVAIGLLGVLACSSWGFALGTLVPGRFISPFVAVAVFIALVAPSSSQAPSELRYLTPLSTSPIADVFFGVRPYIAVELALWLGGLSIAAVGIVFLKYRRSGLAISVCSVGGIAAFSGFMMLAQVGSAAVSDNDIAPYEPVCEERDITICVHPAYQDLLLETADAIEPIAEPLVGLPGGPQRAEQRPRYTTLLPDGTIRFYLHDVSNTGDYLAWTTASALVGENGLCTEHPPFAGGSPPAGYTARNAIGAWLMQEAGMNPDFFVGGYPEIREALDRFSNLDAGDQRSWLEEHYDDLRNCKLGAEAMP